MIFGVTVFNGADGGSVFENVTQLTSFTLPNCIQSIGYKSVYSTYPLTYITIPSSVTNIGDLAFAFNAHIKKIKLLGRTPPTIYTNTFYNTSYLFEVPLESLNAYKTATNWAAYASRIVAKVDTNYLTEQLPQILDYTSEV